MNEDGEMTRREQRPDEEPEVDDSFLREFQWQEEDQKEEDVESLIRETSFSLKRLEEGGIQLLWSSLEPSEELLWSRRGNTIRSITLRGWRYSEHMELGVCEMGEDFRASLKALEKRSVLKAAYVSRFRSGAAGDDRVEFLEEHGGKERWEESFVAAISEIASGAAPERIVLSLAGLSLAETSPSRVWYIGGEELRLKMGKGFLVLEVENDLEPWEVKIGLESGYIRGERFQAEAKTWRFTLPAGMGWEELLYRPLVIEFRSMRNVYSTIRYLWPSVSVVELMEAISRAGIE